MRGLTALDCLSGFHGLPSILARDSPHPPQLVLARLAHPPTLRWNDYRPGARTTSYVPRQRRRLSAGQRRKGESV